MRGSRWGGYRGFRGRMGDMVFEDPIEIEKLYINFKGLARPYRQYVMPASLTRDIENNWYQLYFLVKRYLTCMDIVVCSTIKIDEARKAMNRGEPSIGELAHVENFRFYSAICDRFGPMNMVAARDSALAIWDYWVTLRRFESLLRSDARLIAAFSPSHFKRILDNFRTAFPEAEQARHAAAHSDDFTTTPGQRQKNAVPGPLDVAGLIIEDGVTGSNFRIDTGPGFVQSKDGRVVKHELNLVNFYKLCRHLEEVSDYHSCGWVLLAEALFPSDPSVGLEAARLRESQ
jgi:hypothetical protein